MTLFMLARWRSVEQSVAPAKAELARHAWQRGKSIPDLNKEHDYLSQRVDAVRKFLGSRIVWAEYTHDLSNRLPLTANLTSFQGFNEFDDGKSKKGKNSLTLRAAAPIPTQGSSPKEIDQFLTSLRDSSLLRRDFPLVSLADIKCSESKKKGVPPQALFTVICLAKSVATPPAPSEKAKEDHK